MYLRYALCLIAVFWILFAICGQVLSFESADRIKRELSLHPKDPAVLISGVLRSVMKKDLNLARSQLDFLGERIEKFDLLPEQRVAYEMLRNDVELLEKKFVLLNDRKKLLEANANKYSEHRDLLYMMSVNEFNLMQDKLAILKMEKAVDLDPLFYTGWEAIDKIADQGY